MITTAALIFAQFSGQPCAPTQDIYDVLGQYEEERIYSGLSGQAIFETWANLTTGTWTAFLTAPDGTSCVMAVGENFLTFDRKPNT